MTTWQIALSLWFVIGAVTAIAVAHDFLVEDHAYIEKKRVTGPHCAVIGLIFFVCCALGPLLALFLSINGFFGNYFRKIAGSKLTRE